MRVKIKVGDNKVEFNMSKSQALLIVKNGTGVRESVHEQCTCNLERCRF